MTQPTEPDAGPDRAPSPQFLTSTRFDAFDLPEPLIRGLTAAGFVQCTPIQAQTLPVSLAGRDVAGQAQTGTGKTAAFLVTVFNRLLTDPERQPGVPSALIVAPTRELAIQIYDEALAIGQFTDIQVSQVIGGVDYGKQADILRKGTDIVVCTPGRIIDYYKQKVFKTEGIRIAVIDEADRLLDLGFAKDMRYILRKLPHYEQRQTLLFSATLTYRELELTYEYMNLPEFIAITPEEVAVDGIEQALIHVGQDKKLELLLGLLKREDWTRTLIFVNTKSGVEWLTLKLKGNGMPAEGITGDLPQRKRLQLMERFKNGQITILIATDVASRGIHVEDISHVFNYDLPQDPENYIHRIGRTARAGKTGKAFSLACEQYVYHLEPLEALLDFQLPVIWPDDDWYIQDVAGPVRTERRTPRGRPAKKDGRSGGRSDERSGGRSGGRAGGGRNNRSNDSKGPRKSASERRADRWLRDRPGDYFPGTFFGFAPESAGPFPAAELGDYDDETVDGIDMPSAETDGGDSAVAADTPPKRKRRRRSRRRRRRPSDQPPVSDGPEGETVEAAAAATDAPQTTDADANAGLPEGVPVAEDGVTVTDSDPAGPGTADRFQESRADSPMPAADAVPVSPVAEEAAAEPSEQP